MDTQPQSRPNVDLKYPNKSTGVVKNQASKGCDGKSRPRVRVAESPVQSANSLCGYTHRICLQNRLEGYEFCIRHILFDKNAPFRQCTFVHPQSNKRCPNAARRTERKDTLLCPWHIKKMFLKRRQNERLNFRTREAVTGTKSFPRLLRELEHYCPEDHEKRRRGYFWAKQDDDTTLATEELRQRIAEAAACLNESDEDPDVDQTLRSDVVDSESESIDSDQEDPLRHAGVFAAEEVSSILSDKMHRLQNLYIEQFRHLKFLLRDKYRKYCLATLLDKDSLVSDFLSEEDANKLRALRRYHKYQGKEALLKIQAKEKRRALSEGINYQPLPVSVCIFEKDNVKCTNRSLPASHYCCKHILYDVHQVLFRPCAASSHPCLNPVISFQHNNTCIIHKDLKTDHSQAKKIVGRDEEGNPNTGASNEPELLFQSIDDISSLALDAVVPSSMHLYGLDQFGSVHNQYGDLGTSELLQ